MGKLVFIGGSKGVGKTSLSRKLSEEIGYEYINTGDRVRLYRPTFEENFVKELSELEGNYIIDTHYAAYSRKDPYNFFMGLSENSLSQINSNSDHSGLIIFITADVETILKRRVLDADPRRHLKKSQIKLENEVGFNNSRIYSSLLGFDYYKFMNQDLSLEDAVEKLKEIVIRK